jgi:hypothetical protein
MAVDFESLPYEQQLEYTILELVTFMSESDVREYLVGKSPEQQTQVIEFVYSLLQKYTEQSASAHRRTLPVPAKQFQPNKDDYR